MLIDKIADSEIGLWYRKFSRVEIRVERKRRLPIISHHIFERKIIIIASKSNVGVRKMRSIPSPKDVHLAFISFNRFDNIGRFLRKRIERLRKCDE